jgi:hypothetical protein
MTQKVLSQYSRKTHSHIGDAVSYQRKHFILEVLFKKFFFVHGLTAHHDEDLSLFEGICFKEVLFDNMDYRIKLLGIILEFLKDIHKTC